VRIVAFHHEAFEQYNEWAKKDKKLFVRLERLIIETAKILLTASENLNR
jgi:Txe/YoeB family toxin of Txe-Axe toxin-antitoxin module